MCCVYQWFVQQNDSSPCHNTTMSNPNNVHLPDASMIFRDFATEQQGRKTLHLHFLLWTKNTISFFQNKKKIKRFKLRPSKPLGEQAHRVHVCFVQCDSSQHKFHCREGSKMTKHNCLLPDVDPTDQHQCHIHSWIFACKSLKGTIFRQRELALGHTHNGGMGSGSDPQNALACHKTRLTVNCSRRESPIFFTQNEAPCVN